MVAKRKNIYSFHLLQYFLITLLCCYFFLGIYLGKISKKQEIFPVFSWLLFAKVPPENFTRYNIVIYQHNGKNFNPGISFYQADKSMVTKNNVVANTLIKKMARSYGKNQREFDKLRNVFEGSFLRGKIKYELVKEEYSLLEKHKKGEIKQTTLGVFSK